MKISYPTLFIAAAVLSVLSAVPIVLLRPDDLFPVITYGIVIPVFLFGFFVIAHKRNLSFEARKKLGLLALLIVALNAPGTIYFHVDGFAFQYDRFLHFSVGFLLLPLVLLLLEIVHPLIPRWLATRRAATVIALAGLFLWEGYQYVNDKLFGSKTFFDYGQSISVDVSEDILFGFAGLVLWIFIQRWRERANASKIA